MAKMLICTLGGSCEPICKSISAIQPQRVLFVCSAESLGQVEESVVPALEARGVSLDRGRYETVLVPDSQDFPVCVDVIKRALRTTVKRWLQSPDNEVCIDFTGGTKCMSAALALVSRRWRCTYVYVGGLERTKDGLGIVVPGTEQVLLSSNPMDSLGYQVIEDIESLFNSMNYSAAAEMARQARDASTEPRAKESLNLLATMSAAYLAWDKFEHRDALQKIAEVLKKPLAVEGLFGYDEAARLLPQMRSHQDFLKRLLEDDTNRTRLVDLLANAQRKQAERRFDDAVARYYRSIEAAAQIALRQRFNISTASVDPSLLPPEIRGRHTATRIGLQSAYKLLMDLGDELGMKFYKMGLDREQSPLSARNTSILAHGFDPVGEEVCKKLEAVAFALCGVDRAELPRFPAIRAE